jgi:DNA-binding transcriptional ArsR family regulator
VNLEEAATKLEALGNSTRLEIFRELVNSGADGSTVGEVREALDIPPSTLSHHIAKLVNAGLVIQERQSRNLICTVDHADMDELMEFLVNNCCTDEWYIQPD